MLPVAQLCSTNDERRKSINCCDRPRPDRRTIPADLDYAAISHLRAEARDRLAEIRPASLGQALRIGGITPADITVLAVHLARRRPSRQADGEMGEDA